MATTSFSASRAGAMARAETYVDGGAFEADLARRVAIRTESQLLPDPAALAECRRYLDAEMGPAVAAMGFSARVYDNPAKGQGPVLLATRIEAPDLPTVLGYGHGDVVRGTEDSGPRATGRGSPRATATDSMGAARPTTRRSTRSTWRLCTRCCGSAAAGSASTQNS